MNEKRFIVETVEITDCDIDESRISEVITDTSVTYSYENLEDIVGLLNEQQAIIQKQKKKIEELEDTIYLLTP